MNKKPSEPDEMRMPAAEFDELMRKALGVSMPTEDHEKKLPQKIGKRASKPKPSS